VNCRQACHLIDDYAENQLGRYERQRLETHLESCPSCVEELRLRSAFERTLWQALASSVQPRTVSPATSARMIQEARGSLHRSIRNNRIGMATQLVASVVAVVLVLVGVLFWLDGIPFPSGLNPVVLFPQNQLTLAGQRPITITPVDQPDLAQVPPPDLSELGQPTLAMTRGETLVEPQPLRPGEAFTITVFLHTVSPTPLRTARVDLDVSGPTGYYRFALAVKGPLPANGVSVLRVTPDVLDTPCREKYLIAPADIFRSAGVYTVRVILVNPADMPET
jgi:hypothetical protein